jgi:hypothetical protein
MSIINFNHFINETRPYLTMPSEILHICHDVTDGIREYGEEIENPIIRQIWDETQKSMRQELELELILRN